MLSKIYSSLLILTVLALSSVVTSKPTFRYHRSGVARSPASKPLKQFDWRQYAAKKRATVATTPKPSLAAFPVPVDFTVAAPAPTKISDIIAALPVATNIASLTGTKLNPDTPITGSANTVSDIANLLGTLSGNKETLNGFSDPSTSVKVPTVSSAKSFPASGNIGIDSADNTVKIPASDTVDTPFDHYISLNNRRDEMGGSDSMDGGHDEST